MHIAFVAPETVHRRETDATVRFDRIVRLLDARGHDVTVLCLRWWESEDVDEFEHEGIDYVAVGRSGRRFALKVPFALRRLDPDVVHAVASASGGAVAASYGARFADAPLVLEWYDADPEGSMERRAARRADVVVVPSRLVRTRIREADLDPERIRVVPTAVDADRVRSVDPDPEFADEYLYARRLDEGANLESFLLALAELEDVEWSAAVLGDGPRREEYESQAADLEVDDTVRFVGELPREERIAAYRAGRAFVQTAQQCTYPTEMAWALVSGCIGIVEYHADSSAHELVEGRERGYRVTTETELVEALREVQGMDAMEFDESFADLCGREVVERYVDLYRGLLDERGQL